MIDIALPIEITTKPKRYRPVGRCIYCGRKSGKLSDEHVIPYGIAGNSVILPKASCSRHGKATGKIETVCLRHLWWPLRTQLGLPTRGKRPPKNFNLRRVKVTGEYSDGRLDCVLVSDIKVTPEEFPFVYTALKLPPPAILVGRNPVEDVNYKVWCAFSEEEFKKYSLGDKHGTIIAPIEPETFCRFLAKISHAYAVAELGFGAFRPVLAEFIIGNPLRALEWIGGEAGEHDATANLHEISWKIQTVDSRVFVVVELRLFACLGSPKYTIVVGEIIHP